MRCMLNGADEGVVAERRMRRKAGAEELVKDELPGHGRATRTIREEEVEKGEI